MPKKIVLFISDLINPGGAERIVVEEAIYLRDKGIETKVITFNLNESALFSYTDLDTEVINKKGVIARIIELRKRFKRINPDLIIAQSYWDCSYVYLATVFTNIKYIMHMHGTIFWLLNPRMYALIHKGVFNEIRNSVIGHIEFISKNPKFSLKEKIVLNLMAILDYIAVRKSKIIFVQSEHMKWEVKKIYNKDAIMLRGCLDSRILNYKPKKDIKAVLGLTGKLMILNVNRLDPRKRIDVLIRAFANITKEFWDAVLVIGGTGKERESLEILSKDLGVNDRVIFVGFIEENELWDYYAACDVFVHPNWAEFAIAPYEALAFQKKVVWSTEMETDEYTANDEHIFPAEPTEEGLVDAIKKALNAKMTKKIDISNYTCDRYVDRIYKICKSLVG